MLRVLSFIAVAAACKPCMFVSDVALFGSAVVEMSTDPE
jgi:hypothetical protein